MFNCINKIVFSVLCLALVDGCTSSSYLAQGKVVSLDNDSVVIRVQASEEYMIGKVYDVYRIVDSDYQEEGADIYMKQLTGKVSVENKVDNTHIKAKVLDGSIKKNDLIKL